MSAATLQLRRIGLGKRHFGKSSAKINAFQNVSDFEPRDSITPILAGKVYHFSDAKRPSLGTSCQPFGKTHLTFHHQDPHISRHDLV
jgi:hypothetical protein